MAALPHDTTPASATLLPAAPGLPLARGTAQWNFVSLFNGRDLTGWRLREPDARRQSWTVRDGALVNSFTDANHSTDLVSLASFKDFTLRFEYRIPPRSNSGVYLRGCYEIQIADDDWPPNIPATEKNGAIWKLAAPLRNPARPLGQWQQVEATVKGNHWTVALNGVTIHDNLVLDRPYSRHGGVKSEPDGSGPILLQGRLGSVAFRNLWIKRLD
jgi:hypothetical protein